jgi:hypothetical protein
MQREKEWRSWWDGLKDYRSNDYSNVLFDSHKADSRPALPSSHTIFTSWFIFYPEDEDGKFLRNDGTISTKYTVLHTRIP